MYVLPLSLLLATAVAQAQQPLTPAAAGLVSSEYAFAAKAATDGTRAAFLANLHPTGMYYIPRPVNGVAYFKTQLEFDTLLAWYPIKAEASASGDLGYTTGPWTFRLNKNDKTSEPSAYGWYISMWGREAGGPWKVLLDIGISTPDPKDLPVQPTPLADPKAAAPASTGSPRPGTELEALEATFSSAAASNITKAYTAYVDDNTRLYHAGRFPLEGSKNLQRYLDPWPVSFKVDGSVISSSGDLGMTRGVLTRTENPGKADAKTITAQYVHIWRKVGGSWKLAVEVEGLPDKK